MTRILLTNVFNLYNRGERLQVDAILRAYPTHQFALLNLYGFLDITYVTDHHITVLGHHQTSPPSRLTFFLWFCNLYLRAWLYAKLKQTWFLTPLHRQIQQCHLAIDLGGETFSDDHGLLSPLKHIFTLTFLTYLGVPYVIFSQTIHFQRPTKPNWIRDRALHVLRHSLYVAPRDIDTYRWLIHAQIRCHLAPDIAFTVPSQTLPFQSTRIMRVGFNISPYTKHRMQDYVQSIRTLLTNGYAVTLLPHVLFDRTRDDREPLWTLFLELRRRNLHVDSFFEYSFEKLRHEIHRCDVLVCSRMHLAIYGLSVGIPCIAISYSRKTLALQQQFPTQLYVVSQHHPALPTQILSAINDMNHHYVSYRRQVCEQSNLIRQEANRHFVLLRSLLIAP